MNKKDNQARNNALLQQEGILSVGGKVNRNKINLMTGVIALPYARMLYESCVGDFNDINKMRSLFSNLYYKGEYQELFDSIGEQFSDMGYPFSKEIRLLRENPDALEYFLRSFLLDLDDIMEDYKAG